MRNLATTIMACTFGLSGAVGCAVGTTDDGTDFDETEITHGELDGNAHPGVVLLLMEQDGAPAFRCSASLLSPTVVLTAGHCTGEPGEFSGMRVFTEADVDNGDN